MGEPCPLCRAWVPEACHAGHTEDVQRLAFALAAMVGHDNPTAEQAGWFIEDAEAIAAETSEGDGWVVTQLPDLPDGSAHWTVNDTEWWFDWNAEGYSPPRPIRDWSGDEDEPAPIGGSAPLRPRL